MAQEQDFVGCAAARSTGAGSGAAGASIGADAIVGDADADWDGDGECAGVAFARAGWAFFFAETARVGAAPVKRTDVI